MTSRPRHTASPHPLDAPEVMFDLFGSGLGLGLGSGFGFGPSLILVRPLARPVPTTYIFPPPQI